MSIFLKAILALSLFASLTIGMAWAETPSPSTCVEHSFDRGRLWQVKKTNEAPSYIFGTMHSKDPRILHLPGVIMQAFNSSAIVMLETSLKDEQMSSNRSMMFGSRTFSLKEKVGKERFLMLEKLTSAYGFPTQALDKLKIWAVAALLSQPPQSKKSRDRAFTLLDRELEKIAHQMNKEVIPLESMAEQLTLFDQMPDSLQVEYLDQVISDYPDLEEGIADLSNHYLGGRLGWILCDLKNSLNTVSASLASFMTDQMINDRNRIMVTRMSPYLKKGGVFVAIGALHLPGEQGVVALLHANGYKIVRKY